MSSSSIGNKLDLNISDLTNNQTEEEDKSSPTSNHQKTALVAIPREREIETSVPMEADTESETSVPKEADTESETSVPKVKSGTDLAPLDNIIAAVNGNLKDCKWCKGTPLLLELDRRVGFASNWRLSCHSCMKKDESLDNKMNYLKRRLENCHDHNDRREVKLKIKRKEREIKKGK